MEAIYIVTMLRQQLQGFYGLVEKEKLSEVQTVDALLKYNPTNQLHHQHKIAMQVSQKFHPTFSCKYSYRFYFTLMV